MGPGADEGFVRVGRGTLGELVLVVREAYVRATTVDVSPLRQVFAHHRGAFDVPARTSWSPRTLPGRFVWFGGLPQCEIQRTVLEAGMSLLRLAHLFGTLVAQGAVGREALDRVVDVTVAGGIGVALLNELFDQGDHLGDVLGGARLDVGQPYAQHLQPFVEGVRVAVYDLLPGDSLLVGPVYDLVLYVRDVLDERHVVTPAPQVPGDHVPEQGRPRVADVDVIVDRRTADVEAEPATLPHLDHLTAHAVLYEQAHAPSLASLARSILSLASSAPNTAKRYAISGPLFLPVSASLRGCRRSLVFIPRSLAHARSPATKSRASSTSPNPRPSSPAAACAKTSSLASCNSSTRMSGFTGPVIARSKSGASERVLISSLMASSAAGSRPPGSGSSRKGSRRLRSSSAGRRRMWLALKNSRRSGSKG